VKQDSHRKTREELVELLLASKAKLGRVPGQEAFCSLVKIKISEVRYWWSSYSEFLISAGFEPNEFQMKGEQSERFENYAKVCSHLKRIPTGNSLRVTQRKLEIPRRNIDDFEGGTAGFQNEFRKWLLEGPDEFRAILEYEGWYRAKEEDDANTSINSVVFQPAVRPFLPICLQSLQVLARGEAPDTEGSNSNIELLFERRTGDAFRCLGFEVEQLGQGTGRKADALAYARRERFALIIDAKVRSNGYVLGTEDRKFLDYAKTHGREIKSQGIDKIYLVVVASSFRESDLEKLSNYVSESDLHGVTLLTVSSLLKWVESSIRMRYQFQLADLGRKFFGNNIISE
jgi:hypothetical protein